MAFTSRPATAADEPLLFALFAAVKSAEFAPLGWPVEQLQPLLELQFRARRQGYAEAYPAAPDNILCLGDGTPVGRHLFLRQAAGYRTVDVAVLPEYRGRGVATWALRALQSQAASENVPLRLRVARTNPALRLYARLGFRPIGEDELDFEMEWQPPLPASAPQEPQTLSAPVPVMERGEILDRILAFLGEIGLSLQFGSVPSGFLPGIQMISGGLRVDLVALRYPGDLLHEAGHLAVMTPDGRSAEFPHSTEPAEEMAAIAWSYAAALHIGIPPEIVFHPEGYRGQAASLLERYRSGDCAGLPILWWTGMTTQPLSGSPSIYPRMLYWLRETSAEPQESEPQSSLAMQVQE